MLYSAVKTMVADHLDRTDLTTQIGNFGTLAAQKLEREPLYFLQSVSTGVTTAGTSYIALPSDFVQECKLGDKGRSSIINSSGKWLSRKSSDEIVNYQIESAGTDAPTMYCVLNSRIELYPIPSGTANLYVYYFKNLGVPGDSSTNAWTTTAFDVLYWAMIAEAWDYLGNDKELIKATTKKDQALVELRSISGKVMSTGQIKYNEV